MASWTQKLTKTLGLDTLARTFQFSAIGCCPSCRLVQSLGKGCEAGCDTQPRRITAGDEDFFEALPSRLVVVPEDPNKLRNIRIAVGLLGYFVTFAFGIWLMMPNFTGGAFMLSLLCASAVPFLVAMTPRLKRPPPTVSNQLSAASPRRLLPPRTAQTSEGTAHPLTKQVRSHLGDESCVACLLVGVNKRGDVVIRARRGEVFQLRTDDGVVAVKGPVELIGPVTVTARSLDERERKRLGLNKCDLAGVEWREHVVAKAARVRVYGAIKKQHVPELSPYREQVADVIESGNGTIVELLA